MRIDSFQLRDPYRPGTGAMIQPWIQPVRRTLLIFRQQWPWVSLATTSLLIVLTTLPIQKRVFDFGTALLAICVYGAAVILFDQAENRMKWPTWQQHVRGVRKLGVLVALTLAHWFLPAASTELWLLYLIPMLTLGVELDWAWAVWLIAIAMLLMFLSAWPLTEPNVFQNNWFAYIQKGLVRALIGGYAGATSYLLARCLAYQSNTVTKALNQLLDATVADRWLNTADAVAKIIADLHSESTSVVTANVLLYEPARNTMRLVGSSTQAGQKLARSGFEFDAEQGITGWAARNKKPCFINDTQKDPENRFLRNAAFPDVRSALAVPVPLDEHQMAVIEIASTIPRDVAYEDLQVMNLVAHYLLASHQRSELLEFHQQFAHLGAQLAERIIQTEEIGDMLEEIGEMGLGLLDADIIRFYYRNPETERIEQRRTVGQLHHDDIEGSPTNAPFSLVNQLMDDHTLQMFPDSQSDPRLIRRSPWHERHQYEPFVIREDVHSCAAMPLIVGKEKLGLMWINYRRQRDFPPALCASIQMLAPFAALAIKSGIQSALAERKRRIALRSVVHDSLAHRLHDVARALQWLDCHRQDAPTSHEEWMIVHCQLERARRVVANLMGERPWLTLQSIMDDLDSQARVIRHIYHTRVDTAICQAPDAPISTAAGNELMFACDEILGNVVRHSQATAISITATIRNNQLCIDISDNGIGFDVKCIRLGHGIASVRDRIQRLNGRVYICSEPGAGTSINLVVPIGESISMETKNDDGTET
ncbi:MAG: GAF domain-containing protein [Caldilineaceae bacterium]